MAKNYEMFEKSELIERIKFLESKLEHLFKENDQEMFVNFPWAGNLGQWYWFYDTNKVTFNDKKVSLLGYDTKEIGPVGFEFFTSKLHPDDYDAVMNNMRDHLKGITEAYEVEYRIQHKDGHYLWYYDRGVVMKRDEKGMPIMLQGIVFDITETKRIEDRLRFLSERDSLTNLFNRRAFFEDIEKLLQEKKPQFSLLMFDVDYFKKINDDHGHLVGDEVLRRLAQFLLQTKKEQDHVYRYGGEEFFLILNHTTLDEACLIAQDIHLEIANIPMPEVQNITVSMGVAYYHIGESIDHLVKRVDDLMYQAKNRGRNCLVCEDKQ